MKHLPHCVHRSGAVPAGFPCHCREFYTLAVATSDLLYLADSLCVRGDSHGGRILANIKAELGDWFNHGLLRDANEALTPAEADYDAERSARKRVRE